VYSVLNPYRSEAADKLRLLFHYGPDITNAKLREPRKHGKELTCSTLI
jgi:hypothetical protein